MGIRTVEIDECQVLSVEELCGRLAEPLNWSMCEISHDEESPWDVHFANSSGEYWMLLDGLVFPTAECVGEPVDQVDVRELMNVDLVWANDPVEHRPVAVVQWR